MLTAAALGGAACSDSLNPPDRAPGDTPLLSRLPTSPGPEQVVPGDVIVKPRAGADPEAVARSHGLARGRTGYANAFVIMHGAAGSERPAAAALRRDARVAYAEPDYLRRPATSTRISGPSTIPAGST
jgi:hypothetical protein